MKYTVIVEKCETGYGAFVPDLPGCVATAATREEVLRLVKEAIECHIEGLCRSGCPVPPPSCESAEVDVTPPSPS
ncbi:MAG TPA: type II toxin-antitoxin system HicB family antitoxin [bacterium]